LPWSWLDLPGDEEGWQAAACSIEVSRGALAAEKGQAIEVACDGLAHVECSRTRKMEVAMDAVMVCTGSLLS
jgi:hypothetical protein